MHPQLASPRAWLWAAGLLLAGLLLAAAVWAPLPAAAALRQRLFPTSSDPDRLPACTASDLQGLMGDGNFAWRAAELASAMPSSSRRRPLPLLLRARQAQPLAPSMHASSCRLRRVTPEAARKCLDGRPLVMIGDSVSRCALLGTAPVLVRCGTSWPMRCCGGLEVLYRCSQLVKLWFLQAWFTTYYASSCRSFGCVCSLPATRYQFLSLIYFLEYGRWPAPFLGTQGEPSPVVQREWGTWAQFYQGEAAWRPMISSPARQPIHALQLLVNAARWDRQDSRASPKWSDPACCTFPHLTRRHH